MKIPVSKATQRAIARSLYRSRLEEAAATEGKMITTSPNEAKAVDKAEKAIQKALQTLEEETGRYVDHVDVDARNFSQLRSEVFLTDRPRR